MLRRLSCWTTFARFSALRYDTFGACTLPERWGPTAQGPSRSSSSPWRKKESQRCGSGASSVPCVPKLRPSRGGSQLPSSAAAATLGATRRVLARRLGGAPPVERRPTWWPIARLQQRSAASTARAPTQSPTEDARQGGRRSSEYARCWRLARSPQAGHSRLLSPSETWQPTLRRWSSAHLDSTA